MSAFGIKLGPFELLEPIGSGGMGEVWKGRHTEQGFPVAVKVITADQAKAEHYQAAFRNEVQAVAGLDHAGIVTVFDHGVIPEDEARKSGGQLTDGSPYLVMEYLSGGRLDTEAAHQSWHDVRELLTLLLDALSHAHARGVVHRDLKLSNVLIGGEDDLRSGYRIIDFGLAIVSQREEAPHTKTTLSAGTPAFEAPEQILGRWRDQGPWTDLYALGCMAFALVSGAPPFDGDNMEQVLRCHLMVPVPALHNVVEVPIGFEGWLHRLLAKHPWDRFRCAADAAYALTLLDHKMLIPAMGQHPGGHRSYITDDEATRPTPEADSEPPAFSRLILPDSGGAAATRVPPIPLTWRRDDGRNGQRASAFPIHGVGLGLYGLRPIPIVARESERDLLWDTLRAVSRTGRSQMVLIRGQTGLGKSRLARWLTERVAEVGAAMVFAAVHSPQAGPASGLARMLAKYLRCVGLPRAATLARVLEFLDESGVDNEYEANALTELMCPASRSDHRNGQRVIRFSSPTERYVLMQRLLERASTQRPAVVWLDDVHWSRDSLYFVRHLLRAQSQDPSPVFFILTVQDEALAELPRIEDLLTQVLTYDEVSELTLQPLERRDQSALVEGLLGLDGELAQRVETRTNGNPLFAVQLVGNWVERGMLRAGESGFKLEAGRSAELPDDLHQLWRTRIERFLSDRPPEAVKALELAAALGEEVETLEWEAACKGAGSHAWTAPLVENLTLSRLAQVTDTGWSFIQSMLRESIERQSREAGRWPMLNRVCAGVLNELYPDTPPGLALRIARHLIAGREVESALPLLLQEAQARTDRSEFKAASRVLDELCELMADLMVGADDPRWVREWILRAEIETLKGHLVQGEGWLRRAEDAAEKYRWETSLPTIRRALAYTLRLRGHFSEALTLYEKVLAQYRSLSTAQQRLVAVDQAKALHGIGEVARARGDLENAESYLSRALSIFEQNDHTLGVADCLRGLGVVKQIAGDLEDAADSLMSALDCHERLGNRFGAAMCLNDLAEVARMSGDLEVAEHVYRRAAGIFDDIGSHEGVISRLNLGLVLLSQNSADQAQGQFEEGLKVLKRRGRRGLAGCVHAAMLACVAMKGEWFNWDTHFDPARAILTETEIVEYDIAWTTERAGDLAMGAGRIQEAAQAFQVSLEQWLGLGEPGRAATVQTKLVKVLKLR